MSRGWQRSLFTDHPGLVNGDADAVFGTGDKVKVWCTECYHRRVEDLADPEILRLWSNCTENWISSRVDALTKHLRDCIHQPDDVRDRATRAHAVALRKRRERDGRHRAHQHAIIVTPPADNTHHHLDADIPTVGAGVEGMIPGLGVGTDTESAQFLKPEMSPVTTLPTTMSDPPTASSSRISSLDNYMPGGSNAGFYGDHLGYPGPFEPSTSTSAYIEPPPFPELPADLLSELDLLDDATLALIQDVLDYPVFGS